MNSWEKIESGEIARQITKPGIYWVCPEVAGMPPGYQNFWSVTCGSTGVSNFTLYAHRNNRPVDAECYVCSIIGGVQGPWYRLATAEPPQEFSLPYATGFAPYWLSTYSKDQFGYVHLYISPKPSTEGAYFTAGGAIATLPAGYRPKSNIEIGCVCHDNTGFVPAAIFIGTGGNITSQVRTTTGYRLHIPTVTFVAAQ